MSISRASGKVGAARRFGKKFPIGRTRRQIVYLPRVLLTRHGTPQLILFGSWLAMLAALLWMVNPWLAVVPGLLFLFLLSFFRDPERKVPGGPEVAVSPADGKLVDIGEVSGQNFGLDRERGCNVVEPIDISRYQHHRNTAAAQLFNDRQTNPARGARYKCFAP